MCTDPGYINWDIGTDTEQFPEKEYINGIFVAVYCPVYLNIVTLDRASGCTLVFRQVGFRFNSRLQVPAGQGGGNLRRSSATKIGDVPRALVH